MHPRFGERACTELVVYVGNKLLNIEHVNCIFLGVNEQVPVYEKEREMRRANVSDRLPKQL